MRASNEGLPRPRVARAQKIIRLHPVSVLSQTLKALAWVGIGEEWSGLFQVLEVSLTREVSFGMIDCVGG